MPSVTSRDEKNNQTAPTVDNINVLVDILLAKNKKISNEPSGNVIKKIASNYKNNLSKGLTNYNKNIYGVGDLISFKKLFAIIISFLLLFAVIASASTLVDPDLDPTLANLEDSPVGDNLSSNDTTSSNNSNNITEEPPLVDPILPNDQQGTNTSDNESGINETVPDLVNNSNLTLSNDTYINQNNTMPPDINGGNETSNKTISPDIGDDNETSNGTVEPPVVIPDLNNTGYIEGDFENETFVSTTQFDGEINHPVEWKKDIRFENTQNYAKEFFQEVDIPAYSIDVNVFDEDANVIDDRVQAKNIEKSISGSLLDKKQDLLNLETEFIDLDDAILLEFNETLAPYETKLFSIKYSTPAPTLTETEISPFKKQVVISSDIHYSNILAYTSLNNVPESSIRLYHIVNGERVETSFNPIDTNNDGLVDRIEWVASHLSDQIYEIVIEISKAEHLDENRNFVSDIYDEVKSRDDVWSEPIYDWEYVRVSFESKLTSSNDITIYARNNQDLDTIVEVYYVNSTEKITEFSVIEETNYYKVLLTNLDGSHDIFDLRVKNLDNNENAYLEFDHIIDPPVIVHGFKVYHNSSQFPTASTTYTDNISAEVDTDHAFLMVYSAGSQDSPGTNLPEYGSCYGYISNETQVTFRRETAGDELWVSWFVIECFNNEFTVRGRGAIELAATVTSNTSSVSGVSDSSQCVVVYGGHSGDGGNAGDWEDVFCNVHLTASNTVTAKRDSASEGTKTTIRYEVVEWSTDYNIYTGEVTVNSAPENVLISGGGAPGDNTVDMDRSWMLANWWTPNNGIRQVQCYYYISDTNQVTIGHYGSSYNNLVRWYVIEFPSGAGACSVQRFSYNWDPTAAPNNVRNNTISSPVNTSRTFIRMSCSTSGTGTAFRRDFNLPRLTTTTSWTETQYNPDAADYDRHETRATIIQLPYNILPTQTGESPTNESTGITLLPQLSVTVDDSDNTTLNATWWSNCSGSWVQFATNSSIDVSSGSVTIVQTSSNFSAHSTTYYWSVNLSDGLIWVNQTYIFTTSIPPQISSPSPANQSTSSTTPICSVIVTDSDGGTVDVRFYENTTGSWVLQQTNSSVDVSSPVRVKWNNYNNATNIGQDYYWKVNVSDGKGCYVEKIYYFTTSAGNPPVCSYENPTDVSTNISTILSVINVTIKDGDGDTFDWSIETSPNVGSNSASGESNGSKTCSISGLVSGTIYYWFVNATDGSIETNETYIFTTNRLPQISGVNPANGSTDVSISITFINATITDADSNTMNWTIETSPNIGSDSGNDNSSGDNISCIVSGLTAGTLYYWYVNVTDGSTGESWSNETYHFTTENNPSTIELVAPSPNGTTGVSLQPMCQIWANDTDSTSVTVYWYENSTGSWILRNTNSSFSANNIVNYTFSEFDNYFTTYWWKVAVNDGQNNVSDMFTFTSESIDTSIGTISPYIANSSLLSINATNYTDVDEVALWYRYSPDNDSGWTYNIGEIRNVSNVDDTWTRLNFWNTYNTPVVVAVNNLDSAVDNEVVVRISNVTATYCDIKLQNPDSDPVTSATVYVIIIDEGAYELTDGRKLEAYKYEESQTFENGNWGTGTQQTYSNSYTNPVVLGQVMSENDTDWSVFFCDDGVGRANPPDGDSLYTCKHVGKDADTTRNPEIVGYIVIEQGSGNIGRVNYACALGADSIMGVDDSPPYSYVLGGSYSVGVATQGDEDGGDGGWGVLYGSDPIGTTIALAVDEDTTDASNRAHTAEQVSYWVFEQECNITSNDSSLWVKWNNISNPDTESPWSWDFDFPNGTGYYEFYSIGNKSGSPNESAPSHADAICRYPDTSIEITPSTWNLGTTTIGSYNKSTGSYFNLTNEGDVSLDLQVNASNAINSTTGAIWIVNDTAGLDNYTIGFNLTSGDTWTLFNSTFKTFVADLNVGSWQTFDLNLTMATTSMKSDPLSITVTFRAVAS